MKVIEFDADRRGRLVTRAELTAYMLWLATAVMDGIQYFIGNGHPYPKTPDRSTAVMGAHLAHMLRDTLEDLPVGIINIPVEDMPAGRNPLELVESTMFCLWVEDQVQRARSLLQAGHRYIDTLEVLRCKIAGVWYCARFEWFLDAIQRDGYLLRQAYPERNSLSAWVRMAGLGLSITMKHFAGRFVHNFSRSDPQVMAGTKGNEYSR
jgi:phytoene/squalene synthetase